VGVFALQQTFDFAGQAVFRFRPGHQEFVNIVRTLALQIVTALFEQLALLGSGQTHADDRATVEMLDFPKAVSLLLFGG
jgi:hypothetical protein